MSLDGASTDHYLDPPATENYTNHGATADAMIHYERDIDDKNRIGVILTREQSKFLVPNEIPQEDAGQRQDRQNFESSLRAVLLPAHLQSQCIGRFPCHDARHYRRLLVRTISPLPMIVAQDRGYHEQYAKAMVSVHHGKQEFKFGAEADFAQLQEALSYLHHRSNTIRSRHAARV